MLSILIICLATLKLNADPEYATTCGVPIRQVSSDAVPEFTTAAWAKRIVA